MASSILVLVILSFMLTAAQSGLPHDKMAERGLPRGIFPSTYKGSSFNSMNGHLNVNLFEDSCLLNFSSEVSQLAYVNPIDAILTPGKVEFNSLVVMKVGPTALDFHPVKRILSPFHPLELTLEFWSTENNVAATVLTTPFSQEKPCITQSLLEKPGATINHDTLIKA